MDIGPTRCLILACGNPLRSDDGVGPWLADWAEDRFGSLANLRILARQQWTPELAEEIAHAESVLFLDASIDSAPGAVNLSPVAASANDQGLATHHLGASELLALAHGLYAAKPSSALQLTVGVDSTELGEEFSERVRAALPQACRLLEETVLRLLLSKAV